MRPDILAMELLLKECMGWKRGRKRKIQVYDERLKKDIVIDDTM